MVLPGVTGELVRLGDVAGLASAVARLARSADLRRSLGAAGRRQSLELFDHRRMVDALERLYLTLLEKRS